MTNPYVENLVQMTYFVYPNTEFGGDFLSKNEITTDVINTIINETNNEVKEPTYFIQGEDDDDYTDQ